jgi:flavorubredoxin
MITDLQSGTRVDEIGQDIYRITVPLKGDAIPGGFSFSHFLIADEAPLLFHSGYRQFFPLVRQAVAAVLPPERLRYIGFSHYEPDESGGVDQFLAIAPEARPVTSDIGAMISMGGPFDRPSVGLADGQELSTGRHRLMWVATPHVPHGWDCGVLYDTTTRTLLCGDLFTQGGSDCPPVTQGDILGPSELFRKPMDYFAHAARGSEVLEKLASLRPELLACMHGSSYRGDGGALLRELAGVLERERSSIMAA